MYSFVKSLSCLDNKRLGKQRVEAKQLISMIELRHELHLTGKVNLKELKIKYPEHKFPSWFNHVATLMWEDYLEELKVYYNISIYLWKNRRGVTGKLMKNNLEYKHVSLMSLNIPRFFTSRVSKSHRSALLFKDYKYYSQFGWNDTPQLGYVWITK